MTSSAAAAIQSRTGRRVGGDVMQLIGLQTPINYIHAAARRWLSWLGHRRVVRSAADESCCHNAAGRRWSI